MANGRYRLRHEDDSADLLLERATDDGWFPLNVVTEHPFTDTDIQGANFLCARWPVFPFVDNLVASRHRPDGHYTLMNRAAKCASADGAREWTVQGPAELEALLKGPFGIAVDRARTTQIWDRLEARAQTLAA